MSKGTTESDTLRNVSVDQQANIFPKEILRFVFLDATSSFKEEPPFQNSE